MEINTMKNEVNGHDVTALLAQVRALLLRAGEGPLNHRGQARAAELAAEIEALALPPMQPGAEAFEWKWTEGRDVPGVWWDGAPAENWDVLTYAPTGEERPVGTRDLLGALCIVYRCPDGKFRAQIDLR